MGKIIIVGGTYNPIHLGHIKALNKLKMEYKDSKILLIPTGIPPHKALEGNATPQERLDMLKIFTRKNKNIELSDIEINREGKSYTIDTIKQLKGKYPNDEMCIFIGSDMLFSFEEWKSYTEIIKLCTIICVWRQKEDEQKVKEYICKFRDKYNAKIELLHFEPIEVSSTQIRKMIAQKKDTSRYLDPEIQKYILDNKIYKI